MPHTSPREPEAIHGGRHRCSACHAEGPTVGPVRVAHGPNEPPACRRCGGNRYYNRDPVTPRADASPGRDRHGEKPKGKKGEAFRISKIRNKARQRTADAMKVLRSGQHATMRVLCSDGWWLVEVAPLGPQGEDSRRERDGELVAIAGRIPQAGLSYLKDGRGFHSNLDSYGYYIPVGWVVAKLRPAPSAAP